MNDVDFVSMYTRRCDDATSSQRGTDTQHSSEVVVAEDGAVARIGSWSPSINCSTSDLAVYREPNVCSSSNVDSCIEYLNQAMKGLALPSLYDKTTNTFDMVSLMNNTCKVVQKTYELSKLKDEYEERIHRKDSDVANLHHTLDLLKKEKSEVEQEVLQTRSSGALLMVANNQLTLQVKAGKDEIKRLQSMLQSRDVQFKHETRKRELELNKLKDRMHQLLADKTDRKNGMVISSVKPKGRQQTVKSNGVDNVLDKEHKLLSENVSLRKGLSELQSELISLLDAPAFSSCNSESDPASKQHRELDNLQSEGLSDGVFEMPYSLVEEDILQGIKKKCNMLKEQIKKIEAFNRRTVESAKKRRSDLTMSALRQRDTEMEKLRSHLERCQYIIEQQELVIEESQERPADEMSTLVESRVLEEKEVLAMRRRYYEEAQKQLGEATGVLEEERKALQEAKFAFLHREFLQMTPFRNSKDKCISVDNHLLSAIKSSIKSAKKQYNQSLGLSAVTTPCGPGVAGGDLNTPKTVDLYRVLGILGTLEKKTEKRNVPAMTLEEPSASDSICKGQISSTKHTNSSHDSDTLHPLSDCEPSLPKNVKVTLFKDTHNDIESEPSLENNL